MIRRLVGLFSPHSTIAVTLGVAVVVVVAASGVAYVVAPDEVTKFAAAMVETAGGVVHFVAGNSALGLSLLGSVVGGGSPTDGGPRPPDGDGTPSGGPASNLGPSTPSSPGPTTLPDDGESLSNEEPSNGTSPGTGGPNTNATTTSTSPLSQPPPPPPSTGTILSSSPPPPVLVTGFVARPGAEPGEIDLAWSPAPVTTYAVYRGVTSGSLDILAITASTTFTDEGLVPGATYYYAVAALTGGVPGPRSTTAASVAQSEGDTTLPTPELPTLALGAAGLGLLGVALRRRA